MNYNKKEEEQINIINKAISELVYEKTQMVKAYNYYHGKRDPEQFRHLEENYGIGTPTSVEFVPLVRKHIDVLVGEYLTIPVLPKVSCKDSDTISKITEEKSQYINDEIGKEIQSYFKKVLSGETGPDASIKEKLDALQKNLEETFISDYEIAAQNVVDWSTQSRNIDFILKRKNILIDLLTTGTCYYRTLESASKTSVNLEALNPLHTFIDRNINSPYSKNSQRAVVRKWLTKNEILEQYGDSLTPKDIENLDAKDANEGGTYTRGFDSLMAVSDPETDGILAGWEVTPTHGSNRVNSLNRYEVYDVEWLQTDKEGKKYVTNRYRGIKISDKIYVLIGKVKNVTRTKDNPNSCTLSINGTFFADRNGNPFSLMLATANLQDRFDVLNFYKDTVIAESGSAGDWVDIAYIPTVLGANLVERLMKWKAYKKQGMALIDSSQEGVPPMNTTFGGFDDTLKYNTIQALEAAIQSVEETCSTITGVFREKLGGIEQRDAVTNVQVGVRQSSYITKQYYHIMDIMTREILLDILDVSKVVYKKGLTGTLVLGEHYNKIFTALPEYFTITDYDIHITDTSEVLQEFETIKQLGMEFSKNNMMDPDIIIEIITSKSLSKMKRSVQASLKKKAEEMGGIQQMQQQLQEAQQQMEQMQKELQQAQQKMSQYDEAKMQLEKDKMENDKELGWFKAKNDKKYNEEKIKMDQKHIEAEVLELYDSNPNNDEIKNIR